MLLLDVVLEVLDVVVDVEVHCSRRGRRRSRTGGADLDQGGLPARVSTAWVVDRVSWSAGTAAVPVGHLRS